MARRAFHEQPWCESCQAPDRVCNGDHSADPVETPLTGSGWTTTDHGVELPRVDVYAMWEEGFGDDSAVPLIYVGAVKPAIVNKHPEDIHGGWCTSR